MSNFSIVSASHENCMKCVVAAVDAESMAKVTGSTGATYVNDESAVGGERHEVTVKRDSISVVA